MDLLFICCMNENSLNELILRPSSRFILFGGKGGVGKTSCAAATAIKAAQLGKKTLIISTDPAHSLSDSLNQELALGEETEVDKVPNLWALEIQNKIDLPELGMGDPMGGLGGMGSPTGGLGDMNDPMGGLGGAFGGAMGGGMGGNPLLAGMGDLAGMQPPGSDEALAFGKVLEFVAHCDYDLVVMDTAPTGHTLRLLKLPETLSSFFGKMMKMRLSLSKMFSGLKNLFSKSEEQNEAADTLESLDELKKGIEVARDVLQDPEQTSFVIVMIPEQMALAETERLMNSLMEYGIPFSTLVVNNLIPEDADCNFCRARREMQQDYLQEIKLIYGNRFDILEVPLKENEIRDIFALNDLGEILLQNR